MLYPAHPESMISTGCNSQLNISMINLSEENISQYQINQRPKSPENNNYVGETFIKDKNSVKVPVVLESVYQKALSRIQNLESALEHQKNSHAEQLKGLHEEVKRLQTVCNDLTINMVLCGGDVNNSATLQVPLKKTRRGSTFRNNVNEEDETAGNSLRPNNLIKRRSSNQKNQSAVNLNKISSQQPNSSSNISAKLAEESSNKNKINKAEQQEENLSILLQKQKTKYIQILERAHLEIKQQKKDLDKHKVECELLKEVLSISGGISFSQKDLKEAIVNFQMAKSKIEHRFSKDVQPTSLPSQLPNSKINREKQLQKKQIPGGSGNGQRNNKQVLPPIDRTSSNTSIKSLPKPPTSNPTSANKFRKIKSKDELEDNQSPKEIIIEQEAEEVGLNLIQDEKSKIVGDLLKLSSKTKKTLDGVMVEAESSENLNKYLTTKFIETSPLAVSNMPKSNQAWNKKVHGTRMVRKKMYQDLLERSV
ncbi:hypothetical protein HDU92_002874 [Lobulomyces angularis]|nr:hypothetical protein HDU92_002874 [Lobulomyces angularis]